MLLDWVLELERKDDDMMAASELETDEGAELEPKLLEDVPLLSWPVE